MCTNCSKKLNYNSKKKEIKKIHKLQKKQRKSTHHADVVAGTSSSSEKCPSNKSSNEKCEDLYNDKSQSQQNKLEKDCWAKNATNIEEKSREEEFDEYLEDLLL